MSKPTKQEMLEKLKDCIILQENIMVFRKIKKTPQIKKLLYKLKKTLKKSTKSFLQDVKEYFEIDENTSSERLQETVNILVKMFEKKQTESIDNDTT